MNNFSRILTSQMFFKPISLLSMAFILNACGSDDSTDQATNPIPDDPQVPTENIAPTAYAGVEQTTLEQTLVTLNGTGSSDIDGTITNYLWQQTQGSAITLSDTTSSSPTFTAPDIQTDETLTFKLTVTDNNNATHSDTVNIMVTANIENVAPSADAGVNQTINEQTNSEQTQVTLDGTNSRDTDGTISSYNWRQTQGTSVTLSNASSQSPTFTAPNIQINETLVFELTVTDNNNATHSDNVRIIITANNQVPGDNVTPIANAGTDQTINEYTEVTLSGLNSQDSDGEITDYQWQQTQGTSVILNTPDQATTSFSFTELVTDEALTFELTVTDDSGDTHTDETTVYIQFFKASLNDTGLTIGGNYPSGNNANCIGETVSQQDCAQGNDANNNNDSDGHSGFSYTKLNSNGDALAANATDWSCVKDNVSGLIWEVKTTDGGLHDSNTDYRWGGIGAEIFGSEFYNDWNVLVNGSNTAALCGFNDWRVPHVNELEGLVNFDRASPTIDTDYFPNTLSLGYLSMNASVNDDTVAWYVHFNGGWTHSNALRDNSDPDRLKYVRLVRGPLVF